MKNYLLLTLAFGATIFAQDGGRGHWEGAIELPNRTMDIKLDIDKTDKGWIGSMVNTQQNGSGLPLEAVNCADGKLTFRIMRGGDSPTFVGALSADGKMIDGEVTASGNVLPLKLKKTGEPKVEVAKPSPAIAKELTGKWEGALEVGQSLRLVLTLSNADGGTTGSLVSVDQGNAEFPVTDIEGKEGKLSLKAKAVGGSYQGQLNKEGTEISGEWSQGGNTLPLTFKKK